MVVGASSPAARRAIAGVIIGALLSVLCGAPTPALATTGSTASIMCSGYSACNKGVFTSHGYEAHRGTSYWSMYAGNNCTNYVAYVETTVYGVAAPAYRLGDAGEWPVTAPEHGAVVNHTPTIGSVAEWDGGSPGIPSPGHVAVVEEVGPDASYIVISQQNVSDVDDYDWTRINASGIGNLWEQWPSHFIHFPDDQGALKSSASSPTTWIVLHVSPPRFQGTKFVLTNAVGTLATANQEVLLSAGSQSRSFEVRFQRSSLQRRFVLLVSTSGSNLKVVRQGGPYATTVPEVAVVDADGTQGTSVLNIKVRPAPRGSPPSTPTTTVPASTSTTSTLATTSTTG